MMKPQRDYNFYSSLAPAITGLINERRASGYLYNSNANVLKELDTFCLSNGFDIETVTKELSDAWAIQRDTEGISSRNIRVSNLRQVAKYLISIGKDAYVPKMMQSDETKVAHVFSPDERQEFFSCLEQLKPVRGRYGEIFLEECKVLFRLYYCCGLRLSEPLQLKWEQVDFIKGSIKILQSKGYKDRMVWITPDISHMLEKYHAFITSQLPSRTFVFPGQKPNKPINDVTVRDYFLRVLAKTSYSDISNPPTIKSFRHTFVVDRLNTWMENGENIQDKLPYLSKYLGHNSIHESLYYYHQVEESFKIIHKKDSTSKEVIPEVSAYEE